MSFSFLYAFVGVFLVSFALWDLVVTTLTMNGGGSASNWLSSTSWKAFEKFKCLRGKQQMVMITGPITLVLIILFWVFTTWAGWVLIFSWDSVSIVRDSSSRHATMDEIIYYTGYTITTIGYGGFRAQDSFGQLASVVAGVNGLSLLTLAVTYSVQVLTAVTEKRSLALVMDTLDTAYPPNQPEDLQQLQGLASELGKLDTAIASTAEKYLAYPIIHFFPDRNRQSSLPLKIANLWRCIELADKHDLPLSASARAQFSKTKILIRALVTNAVERHWSFNNRAKTYDLKHAPLGKLIRIYVTTGGWSWEKDTNTGE